MEQEMVDRDDMPMVAPGDAYRQPQRSFFFRRKASLVAGVMLVAVVLAIVLPIVLTKNKSDKANVQSNEVDMVNTPGGSWPKQCVHTVPSGTRVKIVGDHIRETYPNGTIFMRKECPVKMVGSTVPTKTNSIAALGRRLLQALPGYHSYPVIYWGAPGTNFQELTGSVSVPNMPESVANQVLFYWFGLEPSAQNIVIQPVLQFNREGSGVWNGASWNCCPLGHKHESEPIPLSEGDQMTSIMRRTSGDTWEILTENAQSGQQTVLNSDDSITFPNGLLAMETYTVTGCNQLPTKDTVFSQINSGGLAAGWYSSPQNPYLSTCGGGASLSGTTMTIRNRG